MGQLEAFARFLWDYGAYALSAVFAFLYALERKERRDTQNKLESYLALTSEKMQANAIVITDAVMALERAFLRAGVRTSEDQDDRT